MRKSTWTIEMIITLIGKILSKIVNILLKSPITLSKWMHTGVISRVSCSGFCSKWDFPRVNSGIFKSKQCQRIFKSKQCQRIFKSEQCQLAQRRCHNVVVRLKMRVVATSVSDVVTTSLYNVYKALPQRCYNVATTSTNSCVGAF